MKRLIIFFCITRFSSVGATDSGAIIGIDAFPLNSYDRINLQTVQDNSNYQNGGLVFTFPSFNVFVQIPRIYVSVQLNENSSSTDPYVAVITATDFTSTTVKVYRISSGGVITEAANDEVMVNMLAIEVLLGSPF